MIPLEIKGAVAGALSSVLILAVTLTAGGFYRTHVEGETEAGKALPATENATARGRSFFSKLCALPRSGRGRGRGRPQSSEATN